MITWTASIHPLFSIQFTFEEPLRKGRKERKARNGTKKKKKTRDIFLCFKIACAPSERHIYIWLLKNPILKCMWKFWKKNTQLYCNLLSKYLGQYFLHYLKALPRIYPTDDAELIEIVKEKYLIHLKKAKYVGDRCLVFKLLKALQWDKQKPLDRLNEKVLYNSKYELKRTLVINCIGKTYLWYWGRKASFL